MDSMQRKPREQRASVVSRPEVAGYKASWRSKVQWRWPKLSLGFLREAQWRPKMAALMAVIVGVTGVYTLLAPSRDSASAAVQGDGPIVYGTSGNTTPQFRTHSNTSNNFSAAAGTVAGASPSVVITRTSPTRLESVSGYVDSGGTLRVMCYNGSSWTNEWNVSVGGTGTTRRFDIAYETNSGDVVVLYSTNTATTNELAYRVKPGSAACGSANWSGGTNVDPVRTSGVVQWVKIAWDRRASSNLLTAIWADANSDLSAMQWSGSAWGNEPSATIETSLNWFSVHQDFEDFDVTYESLSGDVMVVWNNYNSGSNSTHAIYKTCTGGTSTCTWNANANIIGAATGGDSISIAPNPNSDEIILGMIDGYLTSDLYTQYWSGSAWSGATGVRDTTVNTPGAGDRLVATGWLISGATTRSVIVYNDSNGTAVSWYVGNGSTITKQTDFTPTPAFGNPRDVYEIQMDPNNQDRFMLTASDTNSDLFAKRLVMTSAGAFTWTNTDGGAALEANLTQKTVGDFSFAYWRTAPSYNQAAYRWYANADSVQPGSALASENTAATITDRTAPVRLRMGTTNIGTNLAASSQAFKLQYGTSSSGPWMDVGSASSPWCNTSTPVTCNTSWTNRRRVTFNNTASGSTLSNFPVLVSLTTSNFDFSKARSDGFDVVFTDSSGTALNFEREKYDGSTTGLFWVSVPSLPNNATTYINMYYGNAAASSDPVTTAVKNSTWDTNFKGVWHLGENPAGTAPQMKDSTSDGYNGTTTNAPTTTTGQMGSALNFNGTNQYVDMGNQTNLFTSGAFTVEAWAKATGGAGTQRFVIADYSAGANPVSSYSLLTDSDNLWHFGWQNPTATSNLTNSTTTVTVGTWYHVVGVYDGTTRRIYVNGVQEGTNAVAQTHTDVGANTRIGTAGSQAVSYFPGVIDEVRYSSTNRSADWIKAEYLNQTNAFSTYGSEESQINSGWRFYDNATPADGSAVTTNLLAASTAGDKENYTESNPTGSNPTAIASVETGEWDFSLDGSGLCGGVYYFRMVEADGTTFISYTNYPQITVDNIAPVDQVMRHGGWFQNETKRPYSCDWAG